MGVSQPARYGEEWSDERVKGYLNRETTEGENPDFHVLYIAYKHMRSCDFERFIVFFKEAGRDLNARNKNGKTLLDIVSEHGKAGEFVAILQAAQA
jgi:hypothetical protein